jgi:hypothetical protein
MKPHPFPGPDDELYYLPADAAAIAGCDQRTIRSRCVVQTSPDVVAGVLHTAPTRPGRKPSWVVSERTFREAFPEADLGSGAEDSLGAGEPGVGGERSSPQRATPSELRERLSTIEAARSYSQDYREGLLDVTRRLFELGQELVNLQEQLLGEMRQLEVGSPPWPDEEA